MDVREDIRRIYGSLSPMTQKRVRRAVQEDGRTATWLEHLTKGTRPVSASQLIDLLETCAKRSDCSTLTGLLVVQQEASVLRLCPDTSVFDYAALDFAGERREPLGLSEASLQSIRKLRIKTFNGQATPASLSPVLVDRWHHAFFTEIKKSQVDQGAIRSLISCVGDLTEICNAGKRSDLALRISRKAQWLFTTYPEAFYQLTKEEVEATRLDLARFVGIAVKNCSKGNKGPGYYVLWEGLNVAEEIIRERGGKQYLRGRFGEAYALLAAETIRDISKYLSGARVNQKFNVALAGVDDSLNASGNSKSLLGVLGSAERSLCLLQDRQCISSESNLLLTDAMTRGFGVLGVNAEIGQDTLMYKAEQHLSALALIPADSKICEAWKIRSALQFDILCGHQVQWKLAEQGSKFSDIPYVAGAFSGPAHLV